MANFGHGKKYEVIKNKLLHSAAKLFLGNAVGILGY